MKKILITCTLILSIVLGCNIVMASEYFEPTHKNTKSGKEYGIKEEYRVRELDNGKLEIEFQKGKFTIVEKDEISTIIALDCEEETEINNEFDEIYNEHKNSVVTRYKTLKENGNSSYFPYSKYYEEYDEYLEAWYGGTLILDNVDCINSKTYKATYKGIMYLLYK